MTARKKEAEMSARIQSSFGTGGRRVILSCTLCPPGGVTPGAVTRVLKSEGTVRKTTKVYVCYKGGMLSIFFQHSPFKQTYTDSVISRNLS